MVKNLQCRRSGFGPWVRKVPWRKEQQPTPVFFPGESHGQRSLVGYRPRGCRMGRMRLRQRQQINCALSWFLTTITKVCVTKCVFQRGISCLVQATRDIFGNRACKILKSYSAPHNVIKTEYVSLVSSFTNIRSSQPFLHPHGKF